VRWFKIIAQTVLNQRQGENKYACYMTKIALYFISFKHIVLSK